jgi:hypothetical protein
MDAGGLAGCIDGKLVTIWMREKQLYRCEPGQAEQSLGRGTQGWAASGPDGPYLVWLANRPGALLALQPGAKEPLTIARKASDPVVVGSVDARGPVFAIWEDYEASKATIKAMLLSR